jgi:CBS-domain-containing membrane protein
MGGFIRTRSPYNSNAGGENRLNVEELQIIQKEGTNALTARLANIEPDQPVLMCLKVGRAYSAGDIESYLDILSQFPRFRLVALLKTGDEFVGCISPTELRALVRNEERSFRFEQAVRTGNAVDIKHFPGVATQFIRLEAMNVEPLSVMVANNLNAIAVVDQNRTLRGVVERELLVSKLVLSLAGTSVASGSY